MAIRIKPANKGKFTAYANAHDETVQQAAARVMANHGEPASLRREANFARNAAKWKH